MKYFLTFFILNLIAETLHAQLEKFVEVLAYDTIQTEADIITYTVSIYSEEYYGTDQGSNKNTKHASSVEVQNIALKHKGELASDISNQYTIEPEYIFEERPISIRFHSKENIISFKNELSKFNNVSGGITAVESKREDLLRDSLTKRVLNQAYEQAQKLCEQMKVELGEIVQVSEVYSEDEYGWTAYPPLSGFDPYSFLYPSSTTVVIDMTLRVRFRFQ